MTTDSTEERAHVTGVATRTVVGTDSTQAGPGADGGGTDGGADSGIALAPSHTSPKMAPPPPVGGLRRRRNLLRRRHRGAAALVAADALTSTAVVLALGGGTADPVLLGAVVCGVLALNARKGLYQPGLQTYALDELPALTARTAIAWCVGAALLAAFDRPAALHWMVLLAAIAAGSALATAARALVHGLRHVRARRRPRPALVVGSGELARTVAGVFAQQPRYGLRPVGFVDLSAPRTGTGGDGTSAGDAPLPVVVTLEDVTRAVIQNTVKDAVFLRSPWEQPQNALLAGLLSERGVAGWMVRPGCAVGAHGTHGAGPAHVWGFSCRRLSLECPRPGWSWRKRLLDLVLVTPALVLAAPVLAACALAVRLSDGPGVIFRQERVGLGGGPFTLLKFRTLRPADEKEAATLWSVAGDERMSAVGRLLRRTSLDELPQLWNVLRGDMSLVGPRPERPYFVQQFSDELPGYAERHRSPVGITGLAQVHGLRGNTSIEDRARFDNHYIETWSLWQDVQIMCRTVTSFFRLEGR
ncbi:sugar transferase [Streptomyces ovatisporus]|uniref:Sugar transferase n=1 Tax=Streptomyces ovatisporus TaxID=1128682 RepID=A0ABV9ADE9_9ACTN